MTQIQLLPVPGVYGHLDAGLLRCWLKKGAGLGSVFMILTLFLGCNAQRKQYQLIYQDYPGSYSVGTTNVHAIRVKWHPYRIQVKTDSGILKPVAVDRLWGFHQVSGAQYRLFLGGFYEVVQGRTVLIYRQPDIGDSARDRYFISRTPDSAILDLNRRNLEVAFRDNLCMLKLIAQLPSRDWLKSNNQGHYRLLDAYEYCQLRSRLTKQPVLSPEEGFLIKP
jgi:hypothetical protein